MDKNFFTYNRTKSKMISDLYDKSFLDFAKFIAIVVPILHLILSPVHVQALLKLENEISGFIMFLSILFGLLVLFSATRMHDDEAYAGATLVCVFALILTFCLTFYLAHIYAGALSTQKTLNEPYAVKKALFLCYGVCICYFLSFSLILVHFFETVKKNRKKV